MLPTPLLPSLGVEFNSFVLTLSTSDAYLLPGRFCFEAVVGGTVQWQSICVSWIHSQHTATHAKETKPCYKECLQHVLTKSMFVVCFCYPFMIDQAVLVPRAAAVTGPCEALTLAHGGRLLRLMKAPSGSVERRRFNGT